MWAALEMVGWAVIVPFALGSLVTGIAVSLTTRWGLVRHWWVVLTLSLTVFRPAAGLVVLMLVMVLNVYKPRGRTRPAVVAAADDGSAGVDTH